MIGQTISHYAISEKLGEGGMGVVYKAADTKLGRTVALKFLSPSALPNDSSRARFLREAQAAAKLSHPNIATIYAIEETEKGETFIAMEYVKGRSLKDVLLGGPLPIDDCIYIAAQIAGALERAHASGVIHRDIKPANIILSERNEVKVLDFGLAKLAGAADLTRSGSTVGTAAYMSPEQARGEEVDHRTDQWSLGVVLYEMLSGRQPFRGEAELARLYSILHDDVPPLREQREEVPEELDRVISRLLQKEASDRYERTEDLLDDLRRLAGGSERGFPVAHKRRSARGLPRAVLIGLALVLIGAALLAWVLAGPAAEESPDQSAQEKFVIVVTPFWGPTDAAMEEGKVMQALVARAIDRELGAEKDVQILSTGISEMPRTHEEARELAKSRNGSIVLWGEALVLRDEVEIQPYMTRRFEISWEDYKLRPLRTSTDAREQLGLRKSKSEDVLNMALMLAAQYYSMHNPRKGLAVLDRVDPPSAETFFLKGQMYLGLRDFAAAEEFYQQSLTLDSTHTGSLSFLGNMLMRRRQYPEAIRVFKKQLELDPNAMPGSLAGAYAATGHPEQGISLLKDRLAERPDEWRSYAGLGQFYSSLGRSEEAIQVFHDGLRRFPDNFRLHFDLAREFEKLGSMDLALQHYRHTLIEAEEYGTAFGTHHLMGDIYARQGKLREAVSSFKQSIALSPGYAPAYQGLVDAFVKLDDSRSAVTYLTRLTKRFPEIDAPHLALGRLYQEDGLDEEAIASYRTAIRLNPENGDAHYGLGWMYEFADSLLAAEYHYKEASRVGTRTMGAFAPLLTVGRVYAKQGRNDEAISEYEKAIAMAPGYGGTYLLLGEVYLREGDRVRADETEVRLRSAVEANPSARNWSWLGQWTYRRGRFGDAEIEYLDTLGRN